MTLFFNLPAFCSRFGNYSRNKFCGIRQKTRGLKPAACIYLFPFILYTSAFFFLASCSSQAQTLPVLERQKLIGNYYDRLTPAQRKEFLSRDFENSQKAQAALNSYAEKNRSDAQLLQQRTVRLQEITGAWRSADRLIESVNTYLSEKRDSSQDLKLKGELDRQYIEVTNQLGNVQRTIHHTPFETSQKRELLQQNSDYRSRVDEAMRKLSEKQR